MDPFLKGRYKNLIKEDFPAFAEKIPEVPIETLLNYVEFGYDPGEFMEAFLSHDLFDALFRADEQILPVFKELAWLIHNRLPALCHGSREKVRLWKALRRAEGSAILGEAEAVRMGDRSS